MIRPRTDGPIRILKLVPTLFCGGTEKQFIALSRKLDADRFDVELACLQRRGPFVADAETIGRPVREYAIDGFFSVKAVVQQLRFAHHLARRRVDVVHAYNFYGNVFALPPARLAGAPVVIASVRDCGLYLTRNQLRVQRHVCRLASRILVNADAVRRWLLEQGCNPARIVTIPNGVDLSAFEEPVDPTLLRRQLGLSEETALVTVVSRLNYLKGIEHFLHAAAALAPAYPHAHFLLVGEAQPDDAHYLPRLERLVERLRLTPRVTFAGRRDDVAAIFASSTVAVMPSLNEALSNSLLESMAAGAPTVATRVGGTPEALHDGVSGLLVPPADAHALATAIARLLDAPCLAARLGRAARHRIGERYSVARMVSATERLYEGLLHEARGRRTAPPRPATDRWLSHDREH